MQGVLLAERFRIGDRLGAGGMGQVWAAQDERMRRDVAVKIVHPQYGMDEAETQARFQREVQLAGRLSHQNIVTVHDWGEVVVDGRRTLFLVMELVHGVPLHRRLVESTPAWPLAVGWGAQIAEALHAAHDEGVVHRDIKPANALLTPSGTVKVVDFGVAKFMGETLGARELTVSGRPLGSPRYMSPEQVDGDRAVDHRSDLYSLGCLLYHAVTGRPPFTGSDWAVLRKQRETVPEPPGVHVEGLPARLNDLILSLLAKRPDQRPEDAAAVYGVLSTLLADYAVTDSGWGILDATQLGHSHSVSGRLLKRAWELYRWAEWVRARQLKEGGEDGSAGRSDAAEQAVALVADATTQADRLLTDAREHADAMVDTARKEAGRLIDTATSEGYYLREKAHGDADEVLVDARVDAAVLRDEARAKAEELVSEANSEARKVRVAAAKRAEAILKEAEQQRSARAKETEERGAEIGEATYAVEEAKHTADHAKSKVENAELRPVGLAKIAEARKSLLAQVQGVIAEADLRNQEAFYQVFKQSIDGGFPTSEAFRAKVEVTEGVTLSPGDSERMLNRFVNRFNAELEEDHIA